MKKRLTSILLTLCMVLTLLPTAALAATPGVNILSYPMKTAYKVGEGFDTTGLNAVIKEGGVDKKVNDKITFYTSRTVELTQGRPFTTAGKKVIELRYQGKKVAEYTINVSKASAPATSNNMTPQPATLVGNTPGAGLYRVVYLDIEFSVTAGGAVVGRIPYATNLEVTAIEGSYAKINYKGNLYYTKAINLEKLNAPDYVCSPWAKEAVVTHRGGHIFNLKEEWENDFTRPITREEMACMLVRDIMIEQHGEWVVKFTLPGAFKGADELKLTDIELESRDQADYRYYMHRLLYWGVVPPGKFRPREYATYGEFTDTLIKLMAYDKFDKNFRPAFTKAVIDSFGVGGDTSRNAKITREQAVFLYQKTFCWLNEIERLHDAKMNIEYPIAFRGMGSLRDGIYTISTLLGTKPNQPHLVINAEGKGELSNAKSQNFKITYKKNALNEFGRHMMLYTIQTMDGKYLALSGAPTNGNRLITQDTEYLWCIGDGIASRYADGQNGLGIYSPNNVYQPLNASGWKTADGTPVITWYWDVKKEAIPNNCLFIFGYVGAVS